MAVLALLIVVQLPSLAGGSRASSAQTCRNNLRQLIQAWQMYADHSGGKIAPNSGSSPGQNGTWVKGWLDFSSSYDNISTQNLIGFEVNGTYGHLGPYLETPNVFRCPSDRSTVQIFGASRPRVRSVAMNGWMGGSQYCGQTSFRNYRTLDEIASPADRFVITEGRPDAINDGGF